MDTNPFVGAWRLVSVERKDRDREVPGPFAADAHGILTYTADGHMCVAIMQPHRPPFASDDRFAGTEAERAEAMRTYTSYAGRYEVAGERILHHVEVSLFPNWVGGTQERGYAFEGDRLTLFAPIGTLVWERAAR